MRKCVILVDNSNLYIGGRQYSAQQKGLPSLDPLLPPEDPDWRLDFRALLSTLADDRPVHTAIMVGSTPPGEDFWRRARLQGFDVYTNPLVDGRERGVDTELVARGVEIIATAPEPMILVLASGDRDFLPLIEIAHRKNWEVELWAFSNSFNLRGVIAQAVDRIRLLDDYFSRIGYEKPANLEGLEREESEDIQ